MSEDKTLLGPTPADFFNWISQFAQPMVEAGTKMATQLSNPAEVSDPLGLWRKFYETNEQAWTQLMSQVVSTPEFAAGMGRTASNQAVMHDAVRRSARAYLEAAEMPSIRDISRLASQIVTLDAKVDDLADYVYEGVGDKLTDLVARLDQLSKSAPAPAAGKKGDADTQQAKQLTELGSKLDKLAKLDARLNALEAKLEALTGLEAKLDALAGLESKLDRLASAPAEAPVHTNGTQEVSTENAEVRTEQ